MHTCSKSVFLVMVGVWSACGDTDPGPGARPSDPEPSNGGGGAAAELYCHDPSTPLAATVVDGCADDPAFTDPAVADAEYGSDSESFAFFFARRCATDGAADVRTCTVTDLRGQTACEVSVDCATCYADFGACVNRNCWAECLKPDCTSGPAAGDPSRWVVERCPSFEAECDACRCGGNAANEDCFAELEACTGGMLQALSDACGRGGVAGG
jgi:hypothetical protein